MFAHWATEEFGDRGRRLFGVDDAAFAGEGEEVRGTAKISDAGPAYPTLNGQGECLSTASGVDLSLGYDVTDNVGIHVTGGVLAAVGCRNDRVRALGIAYGGLGARFRLALSERLHVAISPQIAYARTDNGVEKAKTGALIGIAGGIEYYVHVRHFSIGAELALLAPLSPTRVVLGLQPHVRYTF